MGKSVLDMWEVLLIHPDTFKYVDYEGNRLFDTEEEAIKFADQMHYSHGYGYEIWPGK